MKYQPKTYIDHRYRKKDPIGYCWCRTHLGYLNVKLLEEHECLKKECSFLQRYENHPYWAQLEREKAEKQRRKLEKKKRKQEERERLLGKVT